jgi:hypothetical protein
VKPAIDPFHEKVARIALGVAEQHGFALGGGLALVAHGVLDRPTEDVDLFSDRDGSVPAAAELVRNALERAGIEVEVEEEEHSGLADLIDGLEGHMIELTVYRDADDEVGLRLSLGNLYRARSPVLLDIGPVLHLDDLRAWKVVALIARAEPRDLVDVSVFLADFTPEDLIAMARRVDPGIEDEDIASVARRAEEVTERVLGRYGLDAGAVAELRRRFRAWPRPEEATNNALDRGRRRLTRRP